MNAHYFEKKINYIRTTIEKAQTNAQDDQAIDLTRISLLIKTVTEDFENKSSLLEPSAKQKFVHQLNELVQKLNQLELFFTTKMKEMANNELE